MNINGDEHVNIVDAISLVQLIMNGERIINID